jgi:hypothetical protein
MRSSFSSSVVLAGVVVGFASLYGCSSGANNNGTGTFMPGSGNAGSSSPTGNAGTGNPNPTGNAGTGGTDATGSSGSGGSAAPTGEGGSGGSSTAGSGGGSGAGAAGTGGAGGTGGTTVGGDITKVLPSAGCGMAATGYTPGTLVRFTMSTSGVKDAMCADQKCGAWGPWTREYYVKLPTGYMNTKAYPILFAGPGCGGHGNNMYALSGLADTIILVGLTPSADAQAGHATNPGQGCFDDKEGDDSVDWVFYEQLYDKLQGTLCFDRNRVFAGGDSSGAWFSNELGCKYAGDAKRPVRAVMPNTGGLPTDPRYVPTCTTKPMSGFWSHEVGDQVNMFTGNIVAMNRALQVNGCMPAGVKYDTATFDPYPISATDSTSCKKYKGCPDLYPLVVCPLPGNDHASSPQVVNPGWTTFIKSFLAPPLLTQ